MVLTEGIITLVPSNALFSQQSLIAPFKAKQTALHQPGNINTLFHGGINSALAAFSAAIFLGVFF